MSLTMRRTPIVFDFAFSSSDNEHDYTKDWARIGVYWSAYNPKEKNILPVYGMYFVGFKMLVYSNKDDDWFLGNEFIERKEFQDSEEDISTAIFKNTKCLEKVFYESSAHNEVLDYLKLHQDMFDLETWLLENLNNNFQFIATTRTERIIEEYDDEFIDVVDGYIFPSLDLSINFYDEADAMAYKLVWE